MGTQDIEVVNLAQKFSLFSDHWSPKIAGELNDTYLKIVKVQGEFMWHHHAAEDELFMVIEGDLRIKLRDRDLHVSKGEFVVIPKGIEHMPVAAGEAQILLLEPKTTLNTGDLHNERTVAEPERI